MSRRRGQIAGAVAAAAALAMLRRFPPDRFPIYPPCPFYLLTGLKCPGCGATRALAALLNGHIAEAWYWNQLFVVLLPLALGYITVGLWRLSRGKFWPETKPAANYILIGAALIFAVLRNR